MSSQIYKKQNWQRASAELATCTAHVEGCRTGPRALLHALCHYALSMINLAVLTSTAKPPNLISHQFSGYTVASFPSKYPVFDNLQCPQTKGRRPFYHMNQLHKEGGV